MEAHPLAGQGPRHFRLSSLASRFHPVRGSAAPGSASCPVAVVSKNTPSGVGWLRYFLRYLLPTFRKYCSPSLAVLPTPDTRSSPLPGVFLCALF